VTTHSTMTLMGYAKCCYAKRHCAECRVTRQAQTHQLIFPERE